MPKITVTIDKLRGLIGQTWLNSRQKEAVEEAHDLLNQIEAYIKAAPDYPADTQVGISKMETVTLEFVLDDGTTVVCKNGDEMPKGSRGVRINYGDARPTFTRHHIYDASGYGCKPVVKDYLTTGINEATGHDTQC